MVGGMLRPDVPPARTTSTPPERGGEDAFTIFRSDASDGAFRTQLGTYDAFRTPLVTLPAFSELERASQGSAHGDRNPLEHTYDVLQRIATDRIRTFPLPEEMATSSAVVVRLAALTHDLGKARRSGPAHTTASVELLQEITPVLGDLSDRARSLIAALLRSHDYFGYIAKPFLDAQTPQERERILDEVIERRIEPYADALAIDARTLLELQWAIGEADIASIPAFRANLPRVRQLVDALRAMV